MPTTTTSPVTEIRQAAIDHHHDVVSGFERHYAALRSDRFASAFTYGRAKIDRLLDAELASLPRGAAVLDVGCGTGEYLRRIAEAGLVPHGLEPAPGMLAVAKRDHPSFDIREGIATELPYEDGSMDFVLAIEVFRYLHRADTERALAECSRVLKPGGRIFLTMVNRWALDGFAVLQSARKVALGKQFDRKHPHCEFFTPAEVDVVLARAGFVKRRTHGRLLAPMRALFKVNERAASRVARLIETLDDHLHESELVKPFAGHLIAVAERP